MSHEEIALGMGMSRVTLSKHFAAELSIGATSRRLDILQSMYAAARRGNVAAQRAYMALTPKTAAPPALPVDDVTKAPKLGKKEEAQAAGKIADVGTDWESLLRPAAPLQ